MKVKNKKRFTFSIIVIMLIIAGLIFGGIYAFQYIANKKDPHASLDDNPNIKRVKDVYSPEILALIDGNEWGITSDMIANHPLPEADKFEMSLKESFAVSDGMFEKQEANECSGFAAAYVLRAKGINVKGREAYYSMPKAAMSNGYRLPVDIVDKLNTENLGATLYSGTITTLKSRLVGSKAPIIVLTGNALSWQHYITLVGYNDALGEMYFFDSLVEGDSNAERPGNKTMSKADFSKVWANGLPAFDNLYIAIK